jgi:hypothetical protein
MNILLLFLAYVAANSKDYINAGTINENGIYLLDDENFNDFVNYNDIVLVCFYQEADMKPILHSLLTQLKTTQPGMIFELAIVELSRAPILEARLSNINPPDFRLFN